MRILNLGLTLGLLTASLAFSQGPMYDKIIVNLPYPVNVNGTVLQPGDYVIRQHESAAGGSRIVHFYTDGGMKFETTAMAIPALDNRTPEETKLVLDHFGSDYYLNKIWVQGKDYGYEFPIPNEVRMRERERNMASTVMARYDSAPQVAQAAPAPAPEPAPAPAPQAAAPAPEPAPAPVETAQNNPPPAPPVTETPAPAPSTQMADRGPRTMPHTSANWLNLLLGGGLLTGSGFALRRFRA